MPTIDLSGNTLLVDSIVEVQGAHATATNTATLTVAQITSGILVGTPTAAAAYTLPLAATLDAALADKVGHTFDLYVINAATTDLFAITMTTNTGWTLHGNMVVQENQDPSHNSSGHFRIRKTGAGAYTLYRIG